MPKQKETRIEPLKLMRADATAFTTPDNKVPDIKADLIRNDETETDEPTEEPKETKIESRKFNWSKLLHGTEKKRFTPLTKEQREYVMKIGSIFGDNITEKQRTKLHELLQEMKHHDHEEDTEHDMVKKEEAILFPDIVLKWSDKLKRYYVKTGK